MPNTLSTTQMRIDTDNLKELRSLYPHFKKNDRAFVDWFIEMCLIDPSTVLPLGVTVDHNRVNEVPTTQLEPTVEVIKESPINNDELADNWQDDDP